MKRKKYPDTRSLGNSKIAPFIPMEGASQRHERRLIVNLDARAEVKKWCEANGWQLTIKNDGHHWQMKKDNVLVEWWPSSAKLVKDKQWAKGVHCHDWQKLVKYLGKQ